MSNKITKKIDIRFIMAIIALLILGILAGIVYVIRYTPTKETMKLEEYYVLDEGQVATIVNGQYHKPEEDGSYNAIYDNSHVYMNIDYVKNEIDNNYVIDKVNGILRYTNSYGTKSVNLDAKSYTDSGKVNNCNYTVMKKYNDQYYICIDYMNLCSDFNYIYTPNPNRVQIQLAGEEIKQAVIRKNTQLRRFGGVKSKILKEAKKGDKVTIVDNYGKWSLVLSEDGVLGCVKNSHLKSKKTVEVKKNHKEDVFKHNLSDKPIVLGWHQVGSKAGNDGVEEVIDKTKGMNVICPTWYDISSNSGSIISIADDYYVGYCHGKGIKVWGLVSNFEKDIDTTAVLNSAIARDNLINNLINDATSHNLDGINIDFEQLSISAKDGYMEFIKELSLKCKENDLVLSVDNYPPSPSSAFYNRQMEGQYCDYVIVMAYDEHWSTGDSEGSNSSLPFVKEAVSKTLDEVDSKQVILALPFYTKLWKVTDQGFSCSSMGIENQNKYIKEHNMKKEWLEKEAQYYAEYEDNGITYKLWIEDTKSLSEKIKVYSDLKLGGLAFWKLGFETTSVWDTIKSGI